MSNPALKASLRSLLRSQNISKDEQTLALRQLLQPTEDVADLLAETVHERLVKGVGNKVFLRGLVEFSNRCQKNCCYCGLRAKNSNVSRYAMEYDEIVEVIERGYEAGLRSFLLQGGELGGAGAVELVASVFAWMHERWGPAVRPVLSIGELTTEQYQEIIEAAGGNARYLLRIEASTKERYASLHPKDERHSFSARLAALKALRDTGWQVGTGVLIGVPGQSTHDLVDDLLFLANSDIDMCGMGPYVAHPDTPLGEQLAPSISLRIAWTLQSMALLRLLQPRINMAATTALQTLDPMGLERGLAMGANVIMPNLTPLRYREDYQLYTGKTLVADSLEQLLDQLQARVRQQGRGALHR